jgi:hypothetical protein
MADELRDMSIQKSWEKGYSRAANRLSRRGIKENSMADEPKYIGIKEFVEEGYLQEANRQFFHPLGLALSYIFDKDTKEITGFGQIWDYRDDPEGLIYHPSVLKTLKFQEKAKNVIAIQSILQRTRQKLLGWIIQPITGEKE